MKDDLLIRKANPNDFVILKEFMLKALQKDPLAFGVNYEEYAFNSIEWWKMYLNHFIYQLNSTMFLAFNNSTLIGMVGVIYDMKIRRSHLASLVWFYMDQDFRSRGIGKNLMDKILEEIKKNPNIKKVSLIMNQSQSTALNIYTKYGFKMVGTLKDELKIGLNFVDELILEKFI